MNSLKRFGSWVLHKFFFQIFSGFSYCLRITSYNVCYTKLLRIASLEFTPAMDPFSSNASTDLNPALTMKRQILIKIPTEGKDLIDFDLSPEMASEEVTATSYNFV